MRYPTSPCAPISVACALQLDYTSADNDPPGTVSIFKRHYSSKTYREECLVDFEKFDKPYRTRKLTERGMRITGENFTTFSMVRGRRFQGGGRRE